MFDPPLTLKPLPLTDTDDILTFEPPVFFSDTSCAVDVPMATFSNDKFSELGVSTPGASPLGAASPPPEELPVPLREPAHPAKLRSPTTTKVAPKTRWNVSKRIAEGS